MLSPIAIIIGSMMASLSSGGSMLITLRTNQRGACGHVTGSPPITAHLWTRASRLLMVVLGGDVVVVVALLSCGGRVVGAGVVVGSLNVSQYY